MRLGPAHTEAGSDMTDKDIEQPRVFRAEDRRDEILVILERDGKISVDDICRTFDVSAVTARADLNILEERGKVRRIHGGAILVDHALMVEDIDRRMMVNTRAKRRIAHVARRLVHDGDAILVDSGSTAYEFLRTLEDLRNITILTHDLTNAAFVQTHLKNASLILLGGAVRPDHGYCCGALTLLQLRQVYADKAFVATNSFAPSAGFMTENESAAEVKATIIEHARERIMLLDSSKVGVHNFIRFAGLRDFEYVVMDEDPDQVVSRAISSSGGDCRLLLAKS